MHPADRPVEELLDNSTEATARKLAEILSDYLETNRLDSAAEIPPITAQTNMVTGLQLDSFQVMEFMLEVEDHFDIAVDLESLSDIQTIHDLALVVVAAHAG